MKNIFENGTEGKHTKDLTKRKGIPVLGYKNATSQKFQYSLN